MSTPLKQTVIYLSNDGVSQRRIAEILGLSQSGLSKFLERFRQRGDSKNKRRSGRLKKTDERGDRKLLRCVKCGRLQGLKEITNKVNNVIPIAISSRAIRRRLRFHGFTRQKIRKTLVNSHIESKEVSTMVSIETTMDFEKRVEEGDIQ